LISSTQSHSISVKGNALYNGDLGNVGGGRMLALKIMENTLALAKMEFNNKTQGFGLTDNIYVLENIEFSANETFVFISTPNGYAKVDPDNLKLMMATKSKEVFKKILEENEE
jgi:hypothetical protein